MRTGLVLLLLAAAPLSGCATVAISAISADTNRARSARATGPVSGLAERPPEAGDTLDVWLADGRQLRGAYVALTDSLHLGAAEGRLAFAVHDVERMRRPWKRESLRAAVLVGVVADVAVLMYVLSRPPTLTWRW